ncbi:hypothetical protein BKA63DRAFT_267959 [Paraphoma chrysanthemicola]|nr:hypothetical protein BKA63DRAFT_267959 [Paraphoma chrysanthemicola]
MLFEGCVARIERLIRNVRHGVLINGDSHSEPEGSPFDRIQTAINYLFEPEPLRRKNTAAGPDSIALSIPHSTLPDHTGIDRSTQKAQKVDHLQRRQKPRFLVDDEDEDTVISDSPNADLTHERPGKEAHDTAITTQSMAAPTARENGSEGKVVLEIANRLDAFEKASNLQKSEASAEDQKDERPRIKRLSSTEFPREPSEISAVIDSFAKMSIASQFSSTAITEELLKLARTKRAASSMGHPSEASKVLCRFDQILALTASLPHWKIYICVDHKQQEHAKSAMSLIYFSLLEETVSCAVSASEALQEDLNDGNISTEVKRNVDFFCACIQRLSGVQQSVKGTFDAFQHQLDRVVSKLSLLDTLVESMPCAASHDDAITTDDHSSAEKEEGTSMADAKDTDTPATCEDKIFFHEYEPLALACYLSANSGACGSIHASDEEVLNNLEAMSVEDLFGLEEPEIKEEENSLAVPPEVES